MANNSNRLITYGLLSEILTTKGEPQSLTELADLLEMHPPTLLRQLQHKDNTHFIQLPDKRWTVDRLDDNEIDEDVAVKEAKEFLANSDTTNADVLETLEQQNKHLEEQEYYMRVQYRIKKILADHLKRYLT